MNYIIFIPYIISVVESANQLIGGLLLAGLIYSAISAFAWAASEGEVNGFAIWPKMTKHPAIIAAIIAVFILMPTKTTMYQMVALWGGVQIADSEMVQKLAPTTYKVLEKMAADYLSESDAKEEGERNG